MSCDGKEEPEIVPIEHNWTTARFHIPARRCFSSPPSWQWRSMRTTRLLSAMAEEFETLAAESAAREDSDADIDSANRWTGPRWKRGLSYRGPGLRTACTMTIRMTAPSTATSML